MTVLKRIHFYFGIFTILHFVVSGYEMKMNVFSIESTDIATRMMFRANHIYILFSGLIHLLVSYTLREEHRLNTLQIIVSLILVVSVTGINLSFYVDPITHSFPRKLTGYSVQSCLLGTALHLLLLQFYYKKAIR
jgi:hypothetical protein